MNQLSTRGVYAVMFGPTTPPNLRSPAPDEPVPASLRAWYCEADKPGATTHVTAANLVLDAEDIGEPDARGGVRLRRTGDVPALVQCACGSFLRRRQVAA